MRERATNAAVEVAEPDPELAQPGEGRQGRGEDRRIEQEPQPAFTGDRTDGERQRGEGEELAQPVEAGRGILRERHRDEEQRGVDEGGDEQRPGAAESRVRRIPQRREGEQAETERNVRKGDAEERQQMRRVEAEAQPLARRRVPGGEPERSRQPHVGRRPGGLAGERRSRQGFVHEHDGDVGDDRVDQLGLAAEQSLLHHRRLVAEVLAVALHERPAERLGQFHPFERGPALRTDQNGEEFGIDGHREMGRGSKRPEDSTGPRQERPDAAPLLESVRRPRTPPTPTPPTPTMPTPAQDLVCRSCGAPLGRVMVDLGSSPLANSYLSPADLARAELFLPLCVYVCERCWLCPAARVRDAAGDLHRLRLFLLLLHSWLEHARRLRRAMVPRFGLGAGEPGGRDRVQRRLPAEELRRARHPGARRSSRRRTSRRRRSSSGIPTEVRFFGRATARDLAARGLAADLLLGNNVLAHVPELNDFVGGPGDPAQGRRRADDGVPAPRADWSTATSSTPSTTSTSPTSPSSPSSASSPPTASSSSTSRSCATHGGSLRIYARHKPASADGLRSRTPRVGDLLARERALGRRDARLLRRLRRAACARPSAALLEFLIRAKRAGKSIVGYGAPAKGNTLLNYCGVRGDFLDYTVDRSPHKQGRFLPGTRIPIRAPEAIFETRPDYVLILPWNLRAEIAGQMAAIRDWGGQFLVAIPGGGAAVKLVRLGIPGAFLVEIEPARRRARLLRAHLLRARVRGGAGSTAGLVQTQPLVQPAARHAARPALPGRPHGEAKLVRCVRGADPRRAGRPAARVADLLRQHLAIELSDAPRNARLHPARRGARLPHPDRRLRSALPDVGVLRRRPRRAACAGTIRRSASPCPNRCR